jgi:hypothetical protein
MRKIAEHQDSKEILHSIVLGKEEKAESKEVQPQVQLITNEQLIHFKMDELNNKIDYILQWIQNQLPAPMSQEKPYQAE